MKDMDAKTYKVVFTGKVAEGFIIEEVKKRISTIFKMPEGKVERLFRGRPVVIKKNVDLHTARKYSKALKKAGAMCGIAVDGYKAASSVRKSKVAQLEGAVEMMICPSCGHEQRKSSECLRCGIVISKYRERIETPEDVSYPEHEEGPQRRSFAIPIGVKLVFPSIAFLLLLYLVVGWWSNQPIVHGPGPVAPDLPVQEETDKNMFRFKEYSIYPLAGYHIRARVLSKKKYSFGREAELSPFDLALGWGRMSDEDVLEKIKVRQSRRFYFWSTKKFPIPRREIEMNSANTHIIPSNEEIEDRLKEIRAGHIVEIKGHLVRVTAQDGWHWISSLTRKDTGAGACEVLFAESLDLYEHP